MIRTGAGISKISVSSEIDPGFGPDTEQRRVEFAARLEQEAFAIAIGDAEKLAKANFIAALKLWEKEKLILGVKKLDLQQIMIIWLIFELFFIIEAVKEVKIKSLKKVFENDEIIRRYFAELFEPIFDEVDEEFQGVKLDLEFIREVRERYGGDLLFSLKVKNDNEIYKIYEMTYSKLPKSLRDKFQEVLSGFDMSYSDIRKIVMNKEERFEKLAILINRRLADNDDLEKAEIKRIQKYVEAFSEKFAKLLKNAKKKVPDKTKEEIDKKVKSFYGIKD